MLMFPDEMVFVSFTSTLGYGMMPDINARRDLFMFITTVEISSAMFCRIVFWVTRTARHSRCLAAAKPHDTFA
jgi:hypothetical protein